MGRTRTIGSLSCQRINPCVSQPDQDTAVAFHHHALHENKTSRGTQKSVVVAHQMGRWRFCSLPALCTGQLARRHQGMRSSSLVKSIALMVVHRTGGTSLTLPTFTSWPRPPSPTPPNPTTPRSWRTTSSKTSPPPTPPPKSL